MHTFSIEGNLGSGKSTLLQIIKERGEFKIVQEPVSQWQNFQGTNALQLVYDDPKRWLFFFQSMVQLSFIDECIRARSKTVTLYERSIDASKHIFIQHASNSGVLQTHESLLLENWHTFLTTNFAVSPDHFIYLKTSPTVCLQRLRKRNREEEKNIDLDFLTSLDNLHNRWLSQLPNVSVLDGNRNAFEVVEDCLQVIQSKSCKSRPSKALC